MKFSNPFGKVSSSLIAKLLFSTVMITLVSVLGVSYMITELLGQYYTKQKELAVMAQARETSQWIARYLLGEETLGEVQSHLESREHLENTKVIISNENDLYREELAPFRHPENEEFTSEELAKIFRGGMIVKQTLSNGEQQSAIVTAAMPLVVKGRVEGVVSAHSPLYGFQNPLPRIFRLIWGTAFFIIILVSSFTYWVSNRLSYPLRKLNTAALDIASGALDKRVDVMSKDEVGQLAKTFNFMAGKLKELEEMRRDFVANVSHELRSPLTSLRGFLQAGMDDSVPVEERRRYLSIAFEETNRLTRLVNELLELASMQSASFTLKKKRLNLNELVRRVLAKMEPQIVGQGLDVEVSLADPDPVVEGDWDRLEQVLVNLLDNAISFSFQGGKLFLQTCQENDSVQVTVADTGRGIPADELPKIWERFHKVDKVRRRTSSGTGLGLAIVKRLIEAHDGEIRVESEVNRGTTFTFTLPR